jgi:hypothetical protein
MRIVSKNFNVLEKMYLQYWSRYAHMKPEGKGPTHTVQINRCTAHDLAFIFIMFHQVPYRYGTSLLRREGKLDCLMKKQNIVVI